jgi:hypothetical protein
MAATTAILDNILKGWKNAYLQVSNGEVDKSASFEMNERRVFRKYTNERMW